MDRLKITVILSIILTRSAFPDVLYWQIGGNATVDGIGAGDFVSVYARANYTFDVGGNSGKIAGARTVAFVGDSVDPIEMEIVENQGGGWRSTGFNDTLVVDDDDRFVGTVNGIYSSIEISDPVGLSFAIELGNWEDGNWVTLATSEKMSYLDLKSAFDGSVHILGPGDDPNMVNFQPWYPSAYSSPEPSTKILLLVGIGILTLMRPTNQTK